MMHQAFSKHTPLLDVPIGDKSASRWFGGPWGKDDHMKPLQDFKRSKAFSSIESSWEKTCAEHMLNMYEQVVLTWTVSRSKDQKSFGADISGEFSIWILMEF
mgnify:FL=1